VKAILTRDVSLYGHLAVTEGTQVDVTYTFGQAYISGRVFDPVNDEFKNFYSVAVADSDFEYVGSKEREDG
jgi:hypothetical protein